MQFAENAHDSAVEFYDCRSRRMQIRNVRARRLELGCRRNAEGAKTAFNDSLGGPESRFDRWMPDGAHRVVTIPDRGKPFGFARDAVAQGEDLVDLERVKRARLTIQIEA